jgi:hypothetical protein
VIARDGVTGVTRVTVLSLNRVRYGFWEKMFGLEGRNVRDPISGRGDSIAAKRRGGFIVAGSDRSAGPGSSERGHGVAARRSGAS